MFTAVRRGVASVGVLILVTSPLAAQHITGTVRAERDAAPVAGAIVVLLDARGGRLNGSLTGEDGRYELTPPAPGRYALRVDLVGYQSQNVLPFDFAGPADVVRDVRLPFARATLPAVVVTASASCGRFANDDADATRLWDEARKALEATRLAQETRRFPVTVTRTTRVVSLPDSVVRSAESTTRRGVTENPFVSLSPDSVRAFGYRARVNGEDWYYGPDARVLLSDAFVEGHCFRTRQGTGRVGLAFSPMKRGPLVDVDGVLWIDSATAELQTLEFRFVPSGGGGIAAGGEVLFGRMPSGTFGVRAWTIRVPVLTAMSGRQRVGGARAFTQDTVATGVREERGEVLATALTADRRTMRASRLVVMTWDSTRAMPLAGATVTIEGAGMSAVADSTGNAQFGSVDVDGLYQVRAWHARLDSLGLGPVRAPVRLARGSEVRVTVSTPSAFAYARRMCRATAGSDSLRIVRGKAIALEGAAPYVGAQVDAFWWEPGGRTGRMSVASGDGGAFTLCAAAPATLFLTAFQDGSFAVPVMVDVAPGAVAVTTIRLANRPELQSADSGALTQVRGERLPGTVATSPGFIAGFVLGGYGEPVLNLRVTVDGRILPFRSDSTGGFVIPGVSPGAHRVSITALGYAPASVRVQLDGGARLSLYGRLPRSSTALANVTVASRRAQRLDWTRGFDERRKRAAGGTFLAHEDIERHGGQSLADLLRNQPGVSVVQEWAGYRFYSKLAGGRIGAAGVGNQKPAPRADDPASPFLDAPRSGSDECEFTFFLDGQAFRPAQGGLNVEIRAADIQAMEIYPGGATVPFQFGASDVRCGVIAIWTRSRVGS